ncbi:hypothetical protein [Alkalimarinus coralli]|uniref:hypothetical protein n=1 Tax=Alkalimarinus coralli TaxID=2935863 RepID=UPI00202B4F2C|nr:hypothetical protein [Alkalimarinus coralli]
MPNVNVFKEQIEAFKTFLLKASPDEHQSKDIDYLLALGDCFTLVVYGQLIDEIIDFLIRDFSKYAVTILTKPSNSEKQKELAKG